MGLDISNNTSRTKSSSRDCYISRTIAISWFSQKNWCWSMTVEWNETVFHMKGNNFLKMILSKIFSNICRRDEWQVWMIVHPVIQLFFCKLWDNWKNLWQVHIKNKVLKSWQEDSWTEIQKKITFHLRKIDEDRIKNFAFACDSNVADYINNKLWRYNNI